MQQPDRSMNFAGITLDLSGEHSLLPVCICVDCLISHALERNSLSQPQHNSKAGLENQSSES